MFKQKRKKLYSLIQKISFKRQNYSKKILLQNCKTYLFYLVPFFVVYFIIATQLNSYSKLKSQNLENFLNSTEFYNIKNSFFSNLKSPYNEYSYTIRNNDTIEKILLNYNVTNSDIKLITAEIRKRKLSNIYSGTKLKIITKKQTDDKNTVVNIVYPINEILSIEIRKNADRFVINENYIQLTKKQVLVKKKITSSLYNAAIEAGIEPNIIIDFAQIYGFEIDFQRDIRKNDWFEIYYERFVDSNNKTRDTGKIIYASMFVNNKEISLYNFKYKNESGYYDVKGKSIVKTLMKTPINGARLSSSYGMRKHPILGYNKMHQGTDFAAPTGTPIMASGSGVVEMSQRNGAYGNYIRIRHNSKYKTAYAHLSKYAKNIRKGTRVKQGQIIGYVGSTGRSTGPHLHYEVLANSKRINSQKLKLPSGKTLGESARKEFELKRIRIDVKLGELRSY
jgi:murein DD-endopeptidase MepM/ murein hydrolase activator NlpD